MAYSQRPRAAATAAAAAAQTSNRNAYKGSMETTLIDNIEIEPDDFIDNPFAPSSTHPIGEAAEFELFNNGSLQATADSSAAETAANVHHATHGRNGGKRQAGHVVTSGGGKAINSDRQQQLTSIIMMYSPDIPMMDDRDDAGNSVAEEIGNYYGRIETEESVKCIVTSVLFCAVVVIILLVAVLKNPGM